MKFAKSPWIAGLILALFSVFVPLLAHAQPSSGWLGVVLEPAEEPSTQAGLLSTVEVSRVFPTSPAEAAGVVRGDRVIDVNGVAVTSPEQMVGLVTAHPPGATVTLGLVRTDARVDLSITLAGRPDFDALARQYLTGRTAPSLSATGAANGEALSLESYRGQVVLLDFWSVTCVPCLVSIPRLNDLHDRLASSGLTILGLTADPPGDVGDTLEDRGIRYTVGLDNEGQTTFDYLINAFPTLVVIDRAGTVRDVFVGAGELDRLVALVESLVAEAAP